METSDVTRAVRAATSVATSLDLPARDAVVLHNSNRVALRLMPCDVVARVTRGGHEGARLELERARRLAEVGCPVGAVHPQVDPVVYTHDGFAVTLWTHYPPGQTDLAPVDYAGSLARLHAGMRQAHLSSPRFTDRIAEAHQVTADPDQSPELGGADREFLATRLESLGRRIDDHGAVEQLLHGEPHAGNVLGSKDGPLFIDFETCCRGPVEFDLAHVPDAVCEHYPNVDRALLEDCRHLVLAVLAAWRWRIGDEFPDRRRWGQAFLRALREGPPWPTVDTMTKRFDAL